MIYSGIYCRDNKLQRTSFRKLISGEWKYYKEWKLCQKS